ncbi:transposase [Corynebacterium ulcerans]|uniref:transposase n=1 Tax=Corynebacterium ulcerans TaxID=65058 RepID=UPI001C11185A|nr:transposase [Corynebacterium ulcerans]
MLEVFPLSQVLITMSGIGIKTAAQILLSIGDGSDFASSGHLATYAGIAPVTRRSGSSIRGEFPAKAGNKRLKTPCSTRQLPPRPSSNQARQHQLMGPKVMPKARPQEFHSSIPA